MEYLTFLGTEQPPATLTWQHMYLREYFGAASSDLTIVPTRWLKRELSAAYGVSAEHLLVIPYGMEADRFRQKMAEATDLSPPAGKKLIICPARLVKVKGHADLLDALALLRKRRSDWICWLVGDGDQRKLLEQQAAALSLAEHVRFLGNRHDVPALLKQADIFVLPSRHDTLPFAVMEAQLAAKPIVVSDAGGLPEMVRHGQTGLLYRKGNSEELCGCLERLLADERLRRQLAANGHRWGKRQWSLEIMLQRIKAAYELARKRVSEQKTRPAPADQPAAVPPLPLASAIDGVRLPVPAQYSLVDQAFLQALLERR
jgi:glycosyltransferase involved in cell wall biosynthesis